MAEENAPGEPPFAAFMKARAAELTKGAAAQSWAGDGAGTCMLAMAMMLRPSIDLRIN